MRSHSKLIRSTINVSKRRWNTSISNSLKVDMDFVKIRDSETLQVKRNAFFGTEFGDPGRIVYVKYVSYYCTVVYRLVELINVHLVISVCGMEV